MNSKQAKPRAKKPAPETVKIARNRKKFVKKYGANCRNWQWSWSFINGKKKFIVFGAWDKDTKGKQARIFSESWEFNDRVKRNAGYRQSREHLRLVEKEGYALYTFPMIFSPARKNDLGEGPAKMDKFHSDTDH